MKISHADAVDLEWIVRKVYNSDRLSFGGMIDASKFEDKPFMAAVLALAPLYYKKQKPCKEVEEKLSNFFDTWGTVFKHPNENTEYTFEMYRKELKDIISFMR